MARLDTRLCSFVVALVPSPEPPVPDDFDALLFVGCPVRVPSTSCGQHVGCGAALGVVRPGDGSRSASVCGLPFSRGCCPPGRHLCSACVLAFALLTRRCSDYMVKFHLTPLRPTPGFLICVTHHRWFDMCLSWLVPLASPGLSALLCIGPSASRVPC